MTSLGKYRHLAHCSTSTGIFCIAAIDHRANLRAGLSKHTAEAITDEAFVAFKKQVLAYVLPAASAVLIDPIFGIGAGIAQQWISGHKGVLSPLEITNYDLHPSQRDMAFIPNWSVNKVKRIGGDGIKLLLPYHPDDTDSDKKHRVVEQIIDECDRYDIPFFLEPIAYSLDPDKRLDNTELRQIVVQMAQTFSQMGVDVLKLQFPVDVSQSDDQKEWAAACEEVNRACDIPWALLSAGVDFTTFAKQAEIACKAGASGIIAGRAVWAEAVQLHGDERLSFLQTEAASRMTELRRLCEENATPWWDRVSVAMLSMNWVDDYGEM